MRHYYYILFLIIHFNKEAFISINRGLFCIFITRFILLCLYTTTEAVFLYEPIHFYSFRLIAQSNHYH